ncbi:rhodanese-like domain-containing protein [Thermovibrio ammonificans]|uniref:Rhodanese domain protein n=1 Tax=Thermovibrio ammonificans (strain DSM 15698 / JCM 12110 / HB-1) TaxID=648996 RepID=E8T630_THEA1|nr:rhodanese-like domain-containing protein [Thermovibrio ammonificans]ADU96614.1 Rhodanese domain protein [Thermovibrio ammonificans HB-1]
MSMEVLATNLKEAIEAFKEKESFGNVNLHRARELIKDLGAYVLDVRPPEHVERENAEEAGIPGAVYIPFTELHQNLDRLPKPKNHPVVVGCKQTKLANRVAGILAALGYVNVYVLDTDIDNLIECHKAHTQE